MLHHAQPRRLAFVALFALACAREPKVGSGSQNEAPPTPAADMVAPVTLLLCGADTISVKGAGRDTLELRVQGETFLVHLVPAASGARYQADADTGTIFWSHGAEASVQVRGEALPPCEQVGAGQ